VKTPPRACRSCRHFRDDPAFIEATVEGLTSLGSGWASVRDDDGLCLRHGDYRSARSSCDQFCGESGSTTDCKLRQQHD
jgi:hypothetical protein